MEHRRRHGDAGGGNLCRLPRLALGRGQVVRDPRTAPHATCRRQEGSDAYGEAVGVEGEVAAKVKGEGKSKRRRSRKQRKK